MHEVEHRAIRCVTTVAALASLTLFMFPPQAAAADVARGELLYNTHCVTCHTTQMHWRSKRLATDWNSLKMQVRRWQKADQLRWNDDEIVNVASYLNQLYYHFPVQAEEKVISRR